MAHSTMNGTLIMSAFERNNTLHNNNLNSPFTGNSDINHNGDDKEADPSSSSSADARSRLGQSGPMSQQVHSYAKTWFKHILFQMKKDLTKQNMQLQSSPKYIHTYTYTQIKDPSSQKYT